MTSSWTDERMDDLKHQVDELGRRMEGGFTEQRQQFNRIHGELARTQEMIIGLHATITRLSLTLVVAAIGLVATQTGLILTQL